MFLTVLTIVHTANTKKELDDTENLLMITRKHLYQLGILKYQQLDRMNTAIPFKVQEVNHENGKLYGQNVISKNMRIADRRQLLNGNSLILEVSGSMLVPFINEFPKNTDLYKLMTTKPDEKNK